MNRFRWLILCILLLAGCSQEQSFEPDEINPEIDVCEICNMGIVHENYATQVIAKNGDVYKFDDIGCMMEFLQDEQTIKEEDVAKKYVRDVNTGEWIELEKAFHSYHPDHWTPMANGVVTFKDKQSAQEYENRIGEVYDYQALLEHNWSSQP
ncbi:nitrous oxide reductase accessory protein NosL [Robertmurraya andreesenii]|uniref:Copper chaperone NosL n=1 Tax=Anoxybacillus andreesenii TaxID=1325932 RepID=A0ABT9V1P5_9BACL|nr:nitrous oxide reductase accessory protein NosL [Robertmurraya andreesenii]MDQ0154864.1 copper chaperone NosL [Robertmurraya andreesenii]